TVPIGCVAKERMCAIQPVGEGCVGQGIYLFKQRNLYIGQLTRTGFSFSRHDVFLSLIEFTIDKSRFDTRLGQVRCTLDMGLATDRDIAVFVSDIERRTILRGEAKQKSFLQAIALPLDRDTDLLVQSP